MVTAALPSAYSTTSDLDIYVPHESSAELVSGICLLLDVATTSDVLDADVSPYTCLSGVYAVTPIHIVDTGCTIRRIDVVGVAMAPVFEYISGFDLGICQIATDGTRILATCAAQDGVATGKTYFSSKWWEVQESTLCSFTLRLERFVTQHQGTFSQLESEHALAKLFARVHRWHKRLQDRVSKYACRGVQVFASPHDESLHRCQYGIVCTTKYHCLWCTYIELRGVVVSEHRRLACTGRLRRDLRPLWRVMCSAAISTFITWRHDMHNDHMPPGPAFFWTFLQHQYEPCPWCSITSHSGSLRVYFPDENVGRRLSPKVVSSLWKLTLLTGTTDFVTHRVRDPCFCLVSQRSAHAHSENHNQDLWRRLRGAAVGKVYGAAVYTSMVLLQRPSA